MNENSQKFLDIFKEIESYLRKILNAQSTDSIHGLIKKTEEIEPVVREYKSYLHKCADLRNRLSHDSAEELIEEASNKAIQKLQKIHTQLLTPPTAYQISSKPVFYCLIDKFLLKIMKIMEKRTYTHVPVYNEKQFVGVLSESSIFDWLAELTSTNLVLGNIKVGNIKKYLDIKNRPNEYFEFVSGNTSAYKIKHWFTEAIKENKRLGAVFVTKNGKKDEEILGIITVWDLPRIKSDK